MAKLLVFAFLLASSPVSGLLEKLFLTENICYIGCHTNYAASNPHMAACKQGCDFKLQNEDCAEQCKSQYNDEQIQASCQVGCTLSKSNEIVTPEKPVIAVDPVPNIEQVNTETTTVGSGLSRPRSIILIRLRQRPSIDMPPMEPMFGNDPIQMFNDIIQRFREHAKMFQDSISAQINENVKDTSNGHPPEQVPELFQKIPFIRVPNYVREDSSSESSEESMTGESLINELRHVMHHPREQQQFMHENFQPMNGKFHQAMRNFKNQWNEFVREQPKIPVWIFIGFLISSSIILWYMVISLCRQTPSRTPLSIRAQELVFHPYEYDGYEKEKIQPDGQVYDVSEPLPIKLKLSNI